MKYRYFTQDVNDGFGWAGVTYCKQEVDEAGKPIGTIIHISRDEYLKGTK